MAWIGAIIQVGASMVGAHGKRNVLEESGNRAYEEGFAVQAEREWEAKQHDYFASQERASAQRSAYEERRIARITESRVIAMASFSGGGASGASIEDIIGDVHQESEYRALSAIYEGGQVARTHDIEASLLRYEGAQAVRAGQLGLQQSKYDMQATKLDFAGTVGSSVSSVASNYGATSGRSGAGSWRSNREGANTARRASAYG